MQLAKQTIRHIIIRNRRMKNQDPVISRISHIKVIGSNIPVHGNSPGMIQAPAIHPVGRSLGIIILADNVVRIIIQAVPGILFKRALWNHD
jgi:hypothetical protein